MTYFKVTYFITSYGGQSGNDFYFTKRTKVFTNYFEAMLFIEGNHLRNYATISKIVETPIDNK